MYLVPKVPLSEYTVYLNWFAPERYNSDLDSSDRSDRTDLIWRTSHEDLQDAFKPKTFWKSAHLCLRVPIVGESIHITDICLFASVHKV